MNPNASDLYQSVVLDHNRSPRCYGSVTGATHRAEGFNPICGDRIVIEVLVTDDSLGVVGFTAQSCALCRASASVMMELIAEKSISDAKEAAISFEALLKGAKGDLLQLKDSSALAFSSIKDFPARAKCVLLPWRTMLSCLSGQTSVSTES